MKDIAKTQLKKNVRGNNQQSANGAKNDPEWACAACELCGMNNNPFTEKDTHRCKTCRKRVHGILCCVEQTEEEEGTGSLYCKKCRRPGKGEGVNRDIFALDRPELEERRLEESNPYHCKEMNASGDIVTRTLNRFQNSSRRNLEAEAKQKSLRDSLKNRRAENQLHSLLVKKKTTGALVGAGVYDISQKEVLDAIEKIEDGKQAVEFEKIEKIYKRELKIYEEGLEAMKKETFFLQALEEISKEPNEKEKKRLQREAKKAKKWLGVTDYQALIKFKQMAIPKCNRRDIPTLLEEKKRAWNSIYKGMKDPSKPTKPVAPVPKSSSNSRIAAV